MAALSNAPAHPLAGKYLTFVLGRECYGIPIRKVREIIQLMEITPVPQTPRHVRGVINLRGKIIPVIDLRIRFQLADEAVHERTCIVVVQVFHEGAEEEMPMGMIVDAVEDVLQLGAAELVETPRFGAGLQAETILGMAQVKGRVKTLLDIDKIASVDALEKLTPAPEEVPGQA